MQAVHVFARTSSQAEMVQANPALQEAVAVMRRTGWLDADSCPSAYAIEQLVSIADRCHAQSRQEPAVESPRRRKLTDGQYDVRHAVDPDRGLSSCHGHVAAPPSSVMNWRRLMTDMGFLPSRSVRGSPGWNDHHPDTAAVSLPDVQPAAEWPAGPWGKLHHHYIRM